MSLGGIYAVTSLLTCYTAYDERRTMGISYEREDGVNFTSNGCFLLVLLLPGRLRCNPPIFHTANDKYLGARYEASIHTSDSH